MNIYVEKDRIFVEYLLIEKITEIQPGLEFRYFNMQSKAYKRSSQELNCVYG